MLKKKGKVAPLPCGVISLPEPTYQYSNRLQLAAKTGNWSLLFPMAKYLLKTGVSGAKAKRRMGVSRVCPTARIWGGEKMS